MMQVLPTSSGNCCVLVDENNNIFIALTNSGYAQRLARALLEEMKTEFIKNKASEDKDGVSSKRYLAEIAMKYNSPTKFDKVAEAQSKVGEITMKIQDEIKKVVGNHGQLNVHIYHLTLF